MHHWSPQQPQQQAHQSSHHQDDDSKEGNLDRLTSKFSQSYSSLTTNKDVKEPYASNVSIKLNDCMKCFVRLPRCEIEQEQQCSKKNTPQTEIKQERQELQEDGQEKNNINQGNPTLVSSLHEQNRTVATESTIDWQLDYPEDYYTTIDYFYSPSK